MTTTHPDPKAPIDSADHRRERGVRSSVEIDLFTDPACPFAFSHEPVRRRLSWVYRDGLAWRPRMIVLASSEDELIERGVTPELVSRIRRRLAERSGMPIATGEGIAPPSPTRRAALAVIAARTWGGAASERLLRQLRVLAMNGLPAAAAQTIQRAAERAGLDAELLQSRMNLSEAREELERETAAARAPTPAAVSLPHLLTAVADGLRYSAPSYVLAARAPEGRRPKDFARSDQFTIPGVQPSVVYEAAIANLAPHLRRHPAPQCPTEVLAWAAEPLAAAEVAAVMEMDVESTRERLEQVADFAPVAGDGYWSPRNRG